MSITEIIFYFFSAMVLTTALIILFTKNVVYAAFSLLANFLGIAAIYVYASADFLAVTQILIYIGGVIILILFGIMLTNRIAGEKYMLTKNNNILKGIVPGLAFLFVLIPGIIKTNFAARAWIDEADVVAGDSTISAIGINLMTDYLLPFEVVAVVLLVGMIGAAYISKKVVSRQSSVISPKSSADNDNKPDNPITQ